MVAGSENPFRKFMIVFGNSFGSKWVRGGRLGYGKINGLLIAL